MVTTISECIFKKRNDHIIISTPVLHVLRIILVKASPLLWNEQTTGQSHTLRSNTMHVVVVV